VDEGMGTHIDAPELRRFVMALFYLWNARQRRAK
jgi:hypothetical protein